jgi:tetratricopeptide (TPR) repeat protein
MDPYTKFIKEKSKCIDDVVLSWGYAQNDIHFADKKNQVLKWFKNFEPKEYSSALEILEAVQYKQQHEIDLLLKKLTNEIKDVFSSELKNVLFFPLGNSSASSGSMYLYSLLKRLQLSESGFKQDDFKNYLNKNINIVFIDDIIGSGNQATRFYENNLKNAKARLFYISLYAFNDGIENIRENTNFDLVFSGEYLTNQLSAFGEESFVFKEKSKRERLKKFCLKYGEKLFPKHPLGYNNTQSLIVFPHNTPNNTLPIIWASHLNEKKIGEPWFPLWERSKLVTKSFRTQKKIDYKIKSLIKEIKKFRKENEYDKAEEIYLKAKAVKKLDDYSVAKLKIQYSFILKNKYYDVKKEDDVLMESLIVFQKYGIEDDIETVKRLLIQTKSSLGEFETAEIFANDILSNSKTDKDFADTHIFLGLILFQKQDLKGALLEMDKAIGFGKKILINNEKEVIDEGIEIITYATQNKSLFSKLLGRLNEAKSFSLKAIEGLRKLEKKKELGMALFEITELSVLQGNFKDRQWSEYIEEAKSIFRELKDFSWLARCYDLVAKIAFMSNRPDLALSIFKEGYKEIRKTNDKNGIAHFLGKFVSFYINQNDVEGAKNALTDYIEYAKANDIERAITKSKEYSLRIAEIDGDSDNKEDHLINLIKEYEQDYNNEQSEPRKAFILGKIASIYEEQGEHILALNVFKKVSKKFKELDISSEYAKSLLMINQLKIKLGYKEGLLETWQEVLSILDGTNYHSLIAIANINCGSYLLETRNLEKAQLYLNDAEHYVLKYKLPNKEDVERLLKEVKDRLDFKKPVEYSFEHIVNRLYFGIDKNKTVFHSLLRYWYYRYQEDIIKHFTNKSGLNNIFFSDNIKYINQFTKNTSWLFSYYLIASNETFQKGDLDVFESPYDGMEKGEQIMFLNSEGIKKDKKISLEKQLLESLNKPQKNGNISRYVHFPVKEKDWKEMKIFIGGYSIGLPSLTYDFFKENNAKSILESNFFWLHFARYTLKDKLFTDTILCWEMKYFPVYLNEHLTSKKITTLSKVNVQIPFQIEFDKSKANEIKKLFNSLFRIENSNAKTALNDFKFDIDMLTENIENTISLSISIVEVQHSVQKFTYPIIIINE